MRTKWTMSILCVCASAALTASCGADGADGGGDSDSMAELCKREPYNSMPMCKGGIQIRVNTCPEIELSLSPARIAPGHRTVLTTVIYDGEADEVTQEWLGDPDGRFDTGATPDVHYYCESLGRKTITLVATDAQGCESTRKIELLCIDATSFENAGADAIRY
jgi:hypothetical protein